MLSILKFGGKLAIVGSAVYVTVDNSVWDKSEYANKAITKVKQSLPEATELLKEIPSQSDIANKWNKGVESVFKTVANPTSVADSASKITNLLSSNNEKKSS